MDYETLETARNEWLLAREYGSDTIIALRYRLMREIAELTPEDCCNHQDCDIYCARCKVLDCPTPTPKRGN